MDFEKYKEQRNNQGGFADLLGIKVTEVSEGFARGKLDVKAEHLNYMGIVHGGVSYSLSDSIAGAAAGSMKQRIVTLNSSFDYLNPGENVDTLYAKAEVIKSGGKITVVQVEVTDQFNNIITNGKFTFYNIRRS